VVNANYITVQELQDFNPGIDFSRYTTTTISGMISRASKWMDSYLGYSLQAETITDEVAEGIVDSNGDLVIFPTKIPVTAVSGITLVRGTNTIDLTLTSGGTNRFHLTSGGSYITYPHEEFSFSGTTLLNNFLELKGTVFFIKLDYTAGYSTIPDDLKDACNLVARDVVARNLNPMGANRIQQGGVSYSFENNRDGDSDNIRDAKQILNNYIRMAMIA